MRVSVVITNHNYVRYVGEAIDSALRQTHADREVIVVDDGSTDGSWDVITAFGTAITCLGVPQGGQVTAAATALQCCTGEVVVFLDADDILLPDALDRLVEPFRAQTGVVKVQGYLSVVDDQGNPLGRRIPEWLPRSGEYSRLSIRRGLIAAPHAYTSGNAWSRAFLERVFPLPSRGWLDDYLHDLAYLHGQVVSLEESVALYRVHGANRWYGSRVLRPDVMGDYVANVESKVHFLADHMERHGYPIRRAHWLKWRRSWRDNLVAFTRARMLGGGRAVPWLVLAASPLRATRLRVAQALGLSMTLSLIWLLPRGPGIYLAQRLLRRGGDWQRPEQPPGGH